MDPNANNFIFAIALQTDGKILAAGNLTQMGVQTRNQLARVHSDGSLDTDFDPNVSGQALSLALQEDGKIIVAGAFGTVGGETRNRIARLTNDPASNQISASPDGTSVIWTRSGSSPGIDTASFESSDDGGSTWTPLGNASRIGTSADWQIGDLEIPIMENLLFRATGFQTANNRYNGSSIFQTTDQIYFVPQPPAPSAASPPDNSAAIVALKKKLKKLKKKLKNAKRKQQVAKKKKFKKQVKKVKKQLKAL